MHWHHLIQGSGGHLWEKSRPWKRPIQVSDARIALQRQCRHQSPWWQVKKDKTLQKEYNCINWHQLSMKADGILFWAKHREPPINDQDHRNCSLPTIVASEPQNEIKHWHKEGFQLVLQTPKNLSHELVTSTTCNAFPKPSLINLCGERRISKTTFWASGCASTSSINMIQTKQVISKCAC